MTDLERLGRHVGEQRWTEPSSVVVTCPVHGVAEIITGPRDVVPFCCLRAAVRPWKRFGGRALSYDVV